MEDVSGDIRPDRIAQAVPIRVAGCGVDRILDVDGAKLEAAIAVGLLGLAQDRRLELAFLTVVHFPRRSRARLPDRAPTRRGDAAVKGIPILGTNRSTIRPADDVAVWARASTAVAED